MDACIIEDRAGLPSAAGSYPPTENEVSAVSFWKKKAITPEYPYDPERERPVIRASICTGEQAAGFKNKTTGAFREVMLIRSEADLAAFQRLYGLERIDKEY